MRKSLLLAGFIIMIISCDKSGNDCTPESFHYLLHTNKQLDTATSGGEFNYQVVNGANIVFEYKHVSQDCKSIADEQYTEYVVFEIPAGTNNFQISNDDLKDINCYFRRKCYCGFINAIPVLQGTLEGTRVSATEWQVESTLTAPAPYNFSVAFDEKFVQ